MCDCKLNTFNCEKLVRQFLGVDEEDGRMDLAARDELIEKMTPLIEKIVNGKLQGNWRCHRLDAMQITFTKLCNPGKIRTWLNNPRRVWFCHWVAAVTFNVVIDIIRKETLPPRSDIEDCGTNGLSQPELRELAEMLRHAIHKTLAESLPERQLVFCMKFAYTQPSNSCIANSVGVAEKTIFNWLDKLYAQIGHRWNAPIPKELAEIVFEGNRHPLEGFYCLSPNDRKRANELINDLLSGYPLEQQLAFYMKFSPLSQDIDALATQLGEKKELVSTWLEQIVSEITLQCRRILRD
jgi:hypothetical protein